MCYMIYGAVDRAIHPGDFEKALQGSRHTFSLGTRHDVKMSAVNDTGYFRVSPYMCDCDHPLGCGDPKAADLADLAGLLTKLSAARGAKCLYLGKAWTGKAFKDGGTVHLGDLPNVPQFLADMKPNYLYRIDLFKKNY